MTAYAERCRCIRDLKRLIPKEVWEEAENKNPTKDNWQSIILSVQILVNNYYNM